MVLVMHAFAYTNDPTTDPVVTCTSSDGGTWTLVKQYLNLGGWHGEMSWWARDFASAPGSPITVTTQVTSSLVDYGGQFMDVRVLTGAAPAAEQVGGASEQVTVPTPSTATLTLSRSITPTEIDSLVYGIGNYFTAAAGTLPTAVSGFQTINEFFDTLHSGRNMSGNRTSPTASLSAFTVGWTVGGSLSKYGQAAFLEILPAPPIVEKNVTEAGTLTDTATVKVTAPTDTGTFADTASVVVQATDAGAFTEAASAGELVPVSDAGIFTDTASVIVGVNIVVSDSGAFTDSAFVSQGAVGDDAGTFTDTATVVVHGSDSGILFDSVRLLDDGYLVAERVKVIPADNRVVRIEGENRAMIATAISDGGLIPSGSYIIPAEPPPDDEEDIITTDGTVIDDTGWLL